MEYSGIYLGVERYIQTSPAIKKKLVNWKKEILRFISTFLNSEYTLNWSAFLEER